MKALYVFDFDDTLIKSNSKVIVNKADGTQLALDSTQYKSYKKSETDSFDYSEFDKYPSGAVFIDSVVAELKAAIALDGADSVVVLTARQNPVPVRQFLDDNGFKAVEVVATGSDNPYSKANYIMNRLKTEDFDEVIVFEDNVKNIRTIRKVVTDAGYKLETNRVTNKGVYTRSQ